MNMKCTLNRLKIHAEYCKVLYKWPGLKFG